MLVVIGALLACASGGDDKPKPSKRNKAKPSKKVNTKLAKRLSKLRKPCKPPAGQKSCSAADSSFPSSTGVEAYLFLPKNKAGTAPGVTIKVLGPKLTTDKYIGERCGRRAPSCIGHIIKTGPLKAAG